MADRLLDKPAPRPRYNELFLLLDVAATVAAKASLAVLGDPWDVEDTREARALHSKAFWDPALKALSKLNVMGSTVHSRRTWSARLSSLSPT
jgi:hypothetical protein